jgi:hypothetical protein
VSACGLKEIFNAVAALLSPLIAVAVAFIAYQQWKTNRNREVRESRGAKLAVYRRVKLLLRQVLYAQMLDPKLYADFCDACAEADFLFPAELRSWLTELEDIAAQCLGVQECLNTAAPDIAVKEINKLEKELDALTTQLRAASQLIRDKFERYLR